MSGYPTCRRCREEIIPGQVEVCGGCLPQVIEEAEERGRRRGVNQSALVSAQLIEAGRPWAVTANIRALASVQRRRRKR